MRRARRRSTSCCAAASSSTSTGRCGRACERRSRATRSRSSSRCTASSAQIELRTPRSSIVAFEEWLQLADARPAVGGDPRRDRALQPRRRALARSSSATGSSGCASSWPRAPEVGAASGASSRRGARELTERLQRIADLADALTADVSRRVRRTARREQARWLLAQLLAWHRREDKSVLVGSLRPDGHDRGGAGR